MSRGMGGRERSVAVLRGRGRLSAREPEVEVVWRAGGRGATSKDTVSKACVFSFETAESSPEGRIAFLSFAQVRAVEGIVEERNATKMH